MKISSKSVFGQKLHLLQGRTGAPEEPPGVEDEGLEKKNQDDGTGKDKNTDETGVCVWGGRITQSDGDGDSEGGGGEHGHDDTMEDDEDENDILEEDDGWGQEDEEEEEEEEEE